MSIKMKSHESLDNFKLSGLADREDLDAGARNLDTPDKNFGSTDGLQKKPGAPRFLRPAESVRPDAGASESRSNANVDYSMFGWLKVVDGTLPATPGTPRQNPATTVEPAGSKDSHSEKESGVTLLQRKIAAMQTRFVTPVEDRLDEDFADERRMAQKFVARFDEPIHAPRETLVSALIPYVAATGFFVCIAGGTVFYFVSGSSDHKAGRAPASEVSFEPKVIPARTGDAAARSPAAKKAGIVRTSLTLPGGQMASQPVPAARGEAESSATANSGKNDTQWKTQFIEAGLPGNAAAPSAQTLQAAPPEVTQAPEPSENWADTLATFKQFVDAKNAAPAQTIPDDKARFLQKLEAWQNNSK